MAKKGSKKRSAKQIAAQKKASRAAARARKGTKAPRKAARRASAKKSPKRSKYKRRARIVHSYKPRGKKRVKTHASHEKPKRRRHRRSRRRNPIMETPKRRRKARRSRRRRNPIMETPRKRRSRRSHKRSRRSNPVRHRHHTSRRRNPLSGGKDFFAGVFGLVVGGLLTTTALRFAATHALVAGATVNGVTSYTDTPAAGQLYNAEMPNAPVWSNYMTIGAGLAAVVTPFAVSAFVKGAGAKTFWQLAGFGALAVVGVKLATDGIAKFTGKTMWGERLFAPEIMAQRDLATGVTPTSTTAPMLAGVPQPTRQFSGVPTSQPAHAAPQPAPQSSPIPVAQPAPQPTHVAAPVNHQPVERFNWATDGMSENSNNDR